ncbi:Uncharacterised protein [Buttiauxella agrestis]|uniref:Uncharacterized protein n=1 Tax=Buttiauxella agrestis TaxID=82977 RepID=A0A381KQ90_9ENTR|nr:hypothetical protein [Buttiauxella agrestis]SUY92977.1 Uncharacterised protein [Buttiauxella agrestis]
MLLTAQVMIPQSRSQVSLRSLLIICKLADNHYKTGFGSKSDSHQCSSHN